MAGTNPFELGKNRIEALSDGIFAIAMTILVLGFKLPELPANAPNTQVAPAILALWPTFLTYSVAFIGLGVYWILHHFVFHVIRSVDGTCLWLNILFFLFISILPFSVQLMNQFPRAEITPVLFGANLAIVGWLLNFQWMYALSRPRIMSESLSKSYRDAIGFRVALAPVAATLTALICFWSVTTSLAIYLLILPFYFLPAKQERKQRLNPDSEDDEETRGETGWVTPRRLLLSAGILVGLIGWYLFRPELLFVNARVDERLSPIGARKLLAGEFKGLAHETRGHAEVLEVQGKHVLRFTNFSTSNGPDVHVYLVAAPDASSDDAIHHAGFINLGKMKGNQGDQNYELPASWDPTTYRSVSLWCERFNVNFGACSLK